MIVKLCDCTYSEASESMSYNIKNLSQYFRINTILQSHNYIQLLKTILIKLMKTSSKILRLLVIAFVVAAAFSSCVSVKAYQKMYLNDKDMELSAQKIEIYETNFQTYREGAAGANGGKVGGGCGCN